MQIEQLTLKHFRGFTDATFNFQPGMNLIVGVNGVGKSTILDSLRMLLAAMLNRINGSTHSVMPLTNSDIGLGQHLLEASMHVMVDQLSIQYSNQFSDQLDRVKAEEYKAAQIKRLSHDSDLLRRDIELDIQFVKHNIRDLRPHGRIIKQLLQKSTEQLMAIYFATTRSIPSQDRDEARAFGQVLSPRRLVLRNFAEWMFDAQENPNPRKQRHLIAFQQVVNSFFDDDLKLQAQIDQTDPKKAARMVVSKNNMQLDLTMLSDGERGMLSLVMDIARRLVDANPEAEDPLREGQAVILIDELDLHLHPKWQRSIVQKLTQTFPNCQFIATTHSPQIIGEVEPNAIIVIDEDHQPIRADQTLGMDSNWILEHVMGTSERNEAITEKLERISKLIDRNQLGKAEYMIKELRQKLGEFPALVELQVLIDRIRFLGE